MNTQFMIPYPRMKDFCKRFGLNAIYAGKHWSRRREDSRYWHELVAMELSRQEIRCSIYKRPVCISFYWDDRMDCSNHAYLGKMIEDALKGRLIQDDSRKYVKGICHWFHDKHYILVEITEL